MAAGDLFNLCDEFLDACNEALATTDAGAIARRYISPGIPAWDCCPQLTVHAGGPAEADTAPLSPPLSPGHKPAMTALLNLVTMTATVLRCSPVFQDDGQPPPVDELEQASNDTYADVWAIWNHLITRKLDGSLWGAPRDREMILDPAIPVLTQGGCAGWQIQVRVTLGGYRTYGGS